MFVCHAVQLIMSVLLSLLVLFSLVVLLWFLDSSGLVTPDILLSQLWLPGWCTCVHSLLLWPPLPAPGSLCISGDFSCTQHESKCIIAATLDAVMPCVFVAVGDVVPSHAAYKRAASASSVTVQSAWVTMPLLLASAATAIQVWCIRLPSSWCWWCCVPCCNGRHHLFEVALLRCC